MTTPENLVLDSGGLVVTVVSNAGAAAARYEINFNTSCYLASVNTVSAATGLFVAGGTDIVITVQPGAAVYAYSATPAEFTVQSI